MKIVVSGGGSGGHISPLIAIIDELKKNISKTEIIFVGSRGGIEEKLLPQTEVRFYHIRSGKFQRYHSSKILNILDPSTFFKNIKGFWLFICGIFDAIRILRKIKPDIVFLKGGYVSLPLGLASTILKYPFFLHESDVVMGIANKFLARKAKKIFVSFPEKNYQEINQEKIVYTGNPIRSDILKGDREEAIKVFGLNKDIPVLLVIGGSQGAHVINELIFDALKDFLSKFQIIHITGDYDYDYLDYKKKELPKNLRERYKIFNFLTNNLKDAYAVTDLVISRAGNNILTELAALSKPAIIIPLVSSANNHQRANATVFSREGAAYIMDQTKITGKDLCRQAEIIIANQEEKKYLAEKIHQFYRPEAASIIASELRSYYLYLKEEKKKSEQKKKNSANSKSE